jgi:hypothetical protein
MRKAVLVLMIAALVGSFMSGCAADLSSGRKFSSFEVPPTGKSKVYLIRDENILAAKLPYVSVETALSDGKDNAIGEYAQKAIVGKDMFVPILMDPGPYLFKTGMKTEITLKPDTVTCLEVGGKYRGITIFNVEEISDQEDCRNTLTGKNEGVQLEEATKRINCNSLDLI